MNSDIFMNIFIQSDIFTIHKLYMLSKLTSSWITNHFWITKYNHDQVKLPLIHDKINWCKHYHINILNYDNYFNICYNNAVIMIKTALVEAKNKSMYIYIKYDITSDQPIYSILPFKFRKKYYNVITIKVKNKKYQMIFRQLKHKNINGFIEDSYLYTTNDKIIKMSYDAMIHYLAIILYHKHYLSIIDNHNQSYDPSFYKYNDRYDFSTNSVRQGIMKTIEYFINDL